MKSAPTIAFEWRPSGVWRVVRWIALGVGAICLGWATLDPFAKVAIALLVGWFEWRTLRTERLWRASTWQLDGDGAWNWSRGGGRQGEATLTQATVLGPLIVLNLRAAGGRTDLPIWPDQLDADTRRHLRMRLTASSARPSRQPLRDP